jgi:hypothetical protein
MINAMEMAAVLALNLSVLPPRHAHRPTQQTVKIVSPCSPQAGQVVMMETIQRQMMNVTGPGNVSALESYAQTQVFASLPTLPMERTAHRNTLGSGLHAMMGTKVQKTTSAMVMGSVSEHQSFAQQHPPVSRTMQRMGANALHYMPLRVPTVTTRTRALQTINVMTLATALAPLLPALSRAFALLSGRRTVSIAPQHMPATELSVMMAATRQKMMSATVQGAVQGNSLFVQRRMSALPDTRQTVAAASPSMREQVPAATTVATLPRTISAMALAYAKVMRTSALHRPPASPDILRMAPVVFPIIPILEPYAARPRGSVKNPVFVTVVVPVNQKPTRKMAPRVAISPTPHAMAPTPAWTASATPILRHKTPHADKRQIRAKWHPFVTARVGVKPQPINPMALSAATKHLPHAMHQTLAYKGLAHKTLQHKAPYAALLQGLAKRQENVMPAAFARQKRIYPMERYAVMHKAMHAQHLIHA